jgi:hypothetical protein
MKTIFKHPLIALTVVLVAAPAIAQGRDTNALTIYSSATPGAIQPEVYRSGLGHQPVPGYAVVRHERDIPLDKGKASVRFTDVAALIDPTTVSFESLTDPAGTRVIEQNFQFDLINNQKLLQKYLDREIIVEQTRGDKVETFSGTLMSTEGGLVLKQKDGSVHILPHNTGVKLPHLPGGLITRPTLVWDLFADQAGSHRSRVSYQTSGITWWSDYNVTYTEGKNANSCKLDVGAWVSILNQSGAGYQDARLKLVAGDVHRAPVGGRRYPESRAFDSVAKMAAEAPAGFAEKSFFEYHLYTLGRPTTLPDHSTKQIELFPPAHGVPCEKTLVYYGLTPQYWGHFASPMTDRTYGLESSRKVDVYLSFKNDEAHRMGMPLPAGRIRVSKLDQADRTLEFIGEDTLDHTPKNEKVLIKMGSAFDVVGERKQVDFTVNTSAKTMTETIEVTLRNHKTEPVTVLVKENLYRWLNWKITARTQDYGKEDSRTIHFPVHLARDGQATLRYTVHYSW